MQMAHLSDLKWDFLRGNNISEFNLGRLVWRRGSQWGVVVALASQTSVGFRCSAPDFGSYLGSVFWPPNYTFNFS